MSISGISGTTPLSSVPSELSDLRAQIKHLHDQASDSTAPLSKSVRQEVHQLRTAVNSLDQAVTSLKAGAQGTGPISAEAVQTVQQDLLTAHTDAKNLRAGLNGAVTSPPQSGPGNTSAPKVDVIA